MLLWTRSLPGQLTVTVNIQWRIVIKGGKMVTVVFGAFVGHLQDQGSIHLGPPMRKREGEKWTAPDVLKGLEKPKERRKKKKIGKDEDWSFSESGKGGISEFWIVMLTMSPGRG
ncbi:hypothetical protein TNCV_143421 [Trichonephila clavipes]|nr:hypothetical protein TNCV_143421 [Trichonephila clavipes]